MRRIAVLTSGGDAPGMNAALRAVVRAGLAQGWEVFGIPNGYSGLLEGRFTPMGTRDVSGILQRGGTILGSSRCEAFKTQEGRQAALKKLTEGGIDALVVIGGNGSQRGSLSLSQMGFPVVGLASTIDNDLYGSEMTLGVDTALNIALEAIDRLNVTASSHHRAFLVEVMGRKCGYLALMAGIAGGAEAIVIPEQEAEPEVIARELRLAYDRGKAHALVVVSEGANLNAEGMARYFKEHGERLGFDLRATKLGHVQRGGNPTAFDRLLGTRFGVFAVDSLAKGKHGFLVGLNKGEITAVPLPEIERPKPLDVSLLKLARILAE